MDKSPNFCHVSPDKAGALCAILGNSSAGVGQTPGAGGLTYAFQPYMHVWAPNVGTHVVTTSSHTCICGHPCVGTQAKLQLIYGTASGLVHPQPKPGPQFTVLLFTWARVRCQVEKTFFSSSSWWDLNL